MFSDSCGRPARDFQNRLKPWGMPADQGLGFDNHGSPPRIEQARPEGEGETDGVVQSSWLRRSLLLAGQLFSQEQDFCAQSRVPADRQREEETKSVCDPIGDPVKE
jgi:hypothetical protein